VPAASGSLRFALYGLAFVAGSVLFFVALALLWLVAMLIDGGAQGRQVIECDYAKCAPLAEFAENHASLLLVTGAFVSVAACAGVFSIAVRRARR
jgi:hypothetical protein